MGQARATGAVEEALDHISHLLGDRARLFGSLPRLNDLLSSCSASTTPTTTPRILRENHHIIAGDRRQGRTTFMMAGERGSGPAENTPDLIGYTSRFSVAPGDELTFMVSSDLPQADAQLVRLTHGDERSPIGLCEHPVPSILDGRWQLTRQETIRGSFVLATLHEPLPRGPICGHVIAYPTHLAAGEQGLMSALDGDDEPVWQLMVDASGDLTITWCASAASISSARIQHAVGERKWASIAFCIDPIGRRLRLACEQLSGLRTGTRSAVEASLDHLDAAEPVAAVLVAGQQLVTRSVEPRAAGTFNGKLEAPTLFSGALDKDALASVASGADPRAARAIRLLALDLGTGTETWDVADSSPHRHAARAYNGPMRACTSHTWRGVSVDPRATPGDYKAMHFHDSDLHNAAWKPTRTIEVPELPSGVYALRLRGDGAEDRIPFIVRPRRGRPRARIALWLPSFTYAAYANQIDCASGSYGDFHPEYVEGDRLLWRHPEWGASTYDVHSDDSGIAISSLARPIPNLRPTYRQALVSGPRHFAGDLFVVHWLHHIGAAFDVIADDDVHREGSELLAGYDVVITGDHPEYATRETLDATEGYVDSGGRLMYLGGNGYYWVTAVESGVAPTVVEVRRGHGGTRTWNSAPGENHHQFTGELGGLWRYRGRPPHALTGVGFTAEGWDGMNRPYRRAPESFTPSGAWAFEGIEADEPIGAGGLVMNGAAGDEMDCADEEHGTPPETLVLASSGGHSDAYWVCIEDVLFNGPGGSGSTDDRVRADVVLTPKRNGGAVFAVGSISWTASLSHQNYANPLAQLTENVLRAFLSEATPWIAEDSP